MQSETAPEVCRSPEERLAQAAKNVSEEIEKRERRKRQLVAGLVLTRSLMGTFEEIASALRSHHSDATKAAMDALWCARSDMLAAIDKEETRVGMELSEFGRDHW